MALQNNPTFRQSAANIQAAEGRKKQSGLYPNPTVGYQGEQIRGGSFHGGEQGFFIQQDIVLGGKLGLNRKIFDQELKQAETEAEEQKVRVATNVRMSMIFFSFVFGERESHFQALAASFGFCALTASKAAIRIRIRRKFSAERSSNVGDCHCNVAGRVGRILVDADVPVSKVNKALPRLIDMGRARRISQFVEGELA